MRRLKFILVLSIICLLLFSCTPAKRISRILKKNPNLIQQVDTTVYFNTSSADTTFVFNNLSKVDTFYIEETKTKIYRHYDTIRVEQESIRDSVIINKEIIKIAEKSKIDKFKESIFNKLIVILTFIVVIMALYMFRNTIK